MEAGLRAQRGTLYSTSQPSYKSRSCQSCLNLHVIDIVCSPNQVIAAEGEQKASLALKEAADVISESPAALQLRYLQTLNSISTEKNSTIVFPLPMNMLQGFMK